MRASSAYSLFDTESVWAILMRIAPPVMLAQLIQAMYNIVDSYFVGQFSSDGLTALSIVYPVQLIVTAIAVGTGVGVNTLMSRYDGQGNHHLADRTAGTGTVLALISWLIFAVLSGLLMRPFAAISTESSSVADLAVTYGTIVCVGSPGVFLESTWSKVHQARGNMRLPMLAQIAGAAANIVLDPLFIFALNMGVRGAALATIISQCLSCVWVLRFLTGPKTMLRLKKENIRIAPALVLPCVALGSATFIMQASESVISMCFNSSLLKYGNDIAVGAMTILSSVMQFAMLPLQGIAQGAQPISSYNYGAKNADRVKKTFRLLLITCLSYSVLLWAAVQLVPRVFVSIFTADTSLIEFTAPMLKIYLGGLFLFGIQIACQMTFTSLGKAVNSIIVAVVRKFVLLIPLIYIMPHMISDSTTGVYMAEPIADITAVIFTSVLFTFQFKKALAEIQN